MNNKTVIKKLTLNLLGAPNIIESFTNANNSQKANHSSTEINNKNKCVSHNSFLRKTGNSNSLQNQSEIINTSTLKTETTGNKLNSHRSLINIRESNKINK